MKLEASILPIHRSTQNLTHLADSMCALGLFIISLDLLLISVMIENADIDATLKSTEAIVKCMDLPSKEEALILKG